MRGAAGLPPAPFPEGTDWQDRPKTTTRPSPYARTRKQSSIPGTPCPLVVPMRKFTEANR